MKILYIKLINYIGIYNGLGLNEIEIDLSPSMYKTVIIRGKNGSGKSTLFNALNPMYDSNDNFIPKLEAHKYITILNDNIIYKIHFIHPVKQNGERDTTKAYIKKYYNNEIEDLNDNGNVSSFKEILYNELSLDNNFLALSSLGSENKGLADKKPMERKKSVISIISSLVVYNDIYKTLTKRTSIFKAMINNLTSKIDNIGDEDKIKASLISIETRLNNLMSEKDNIIEGLSSCKSTVKLIDPNNTIQNTYNQIYSGINNYNTMYTSITNSVNKYYNILKLEESISYNDVINRYNITKENLDKLSTNVQIMESNISILLNERENILSDMQTKKQKLNSLESVGAIEDIKSSISIYEDDIRKYKDIIYKIGLTDMNISRDEYILALNTLMDIKNTISIFKSNLNLSTIERSINYIRNNDFPNIDKLDNDIININALIREQEILYQKFSTIKEISEKIQLRPLGCKINDCLFIKDSLEALEQKPDQNLIIINKLLLKYNKLLKSKTEEKVSTRDIIECINYLNTVLRSIDINSKIFRKLKIGQEFCDKDKVLTMILNGYNFDIIDELYKYIDYANVIDEYRSKTNLLIQLKSDLNIYNSKHDIIQDLSDDINKMRIKVNDMTDNISNIKSNIDDYKTKYSILNIAIDNYNVLIKNLNDKLNIESKKIELISQFNAIKSSMISIKQSLDNIQEYNSKLEKTNNEITPLIEDRDKLKYGLTMLVEYKKELIIYNAKYEKIEYIKKQSSPNKGIQTLFMELYMNKILSMSNELLSLLFDGEYILCPFIINENEFRIPCRGTGLQNDDISSTSCSQKAMMGLVINASLLCQASTKYNILKLDELDAGLDTSNRLQFLYTLDRISDILNIEQTFMITHNTEVDLSTCDIIQLKKVDGESISDNNILYEY